MWGTCNLFFSSQPQALLLVVYFIYGVDAEIYKEQQKHLITECIHLAVI